VAKQSAAQKPPVEKGVEEKAIGKARVAAAAGRPVKVDRLIHERVRLAIVSALAANPSLSFSDLKKLLNTSDGNVSVHARKLEEAEYITCTKSFEGRVPRTEYRLTAAGRRAFEKYLDHMEALIHAMREK
jgi:DNA-binding MarR family transcriptional regulator